MQNSWNINENELVAVLAHNFTKNGTHLKDFQRFYLNLNAYIVEPFQKFWKATGNSHYTDFLQSYYILSKGQNCAKDSKQGSLVIMEQLQNSQNVSDGQLVLSDKIKNYTQ